MGIICRWSTGGCTQCPGPRLAMRRSSTGVLSAVSRRATYAPTEDAHSTSGPQGAWNTLHWGSSRIVIIFMSISRLCWEGGGQGPPYALKKMLFVVHYDFEKAFRNPHFRKTLLVGRARVTQKNTLCMLLIMLTVLDDPLACS